MVQLFEFSSCFLLLKSVQNLAVRGSGTDSFFMGKLEEIKFSPDHEVNV